MICIEKKIFQKNFSLKKGFSQKEDFSHHRPGNNGNGNNMLLHSNSFFLVTLVLLHTQARFKENSWHPPPNERSQQSNPYKNYVWSRTSIACKFNETWFGWKNVSTAMNKNKIVIWGIWSPELCTAPKKYLLMTSLYIFWQNLSRI